MTGLRYPIPMQSLRRFRKFIALAALVWLPMSVFAQVCATQALVSSIGGPQHPGLIAPEETRHVHSPTEAAEPVLIVVDTATFWQSVDDYDAGCDMKALCAFASLAAVTTETSDVVTVHNTPVPPVGEAARRRADCRADTTRRRSR